MYPLLRSTLSAAPLLHAGLQKIARTPRARLALIYRLIPRCVPRVPGNSVLQPHEATKDRPLRLCKADGACPAEPPRPARGPWPLGQAIYLDRLIAGGILGEALPLANLIVERSAEQLSPGGLIDVHA